MRDHEKANKTILITGCSSGIGYEVAYGLRANGWTVFASCRKAEDCARLTAEGFHSPLIDYETPATIASGLSEVLEQTGGTLDALFNNGAYAIPGAIEDLPTDALRQIYEANVFGWHELTRAVIPIMRTQKQGRILQCSSVLGFVVMPWRGAYNSSKHALEGLTKTLRLEMRGTGIHVILIQPGPITSKIRANSIPHFERWIDWKNSPRAQQYRSTLLKRLYESSGPDTFELPPSAVTAKVLRALTVPSPKARYMVTTPTYMMEAFRRILPTSVLEWLILRG
jgi:NAD(P)-dependent dehydrogenase (short-subunit alcohol dehydrogenase family)